MAKTSENPTSAVPAGRGPLTTLAVLFFVVSLHIFTAINSAVPEPYMDEIFHIKQARTYCAGNFTQWDPKLTTLPGLYFVSLAEWKLLSAVITMKDACSIWNLRLTNVFFSVAGLFLFHRLLSLLHPNNTNTSKFQLLLSSLNLATFPLLYFFSFLYYTDQASTFFVFFMLYVHARGRRNLAALIGAVAVFTRQTNIVWVGCLTVWELFKTYQLIMQSVVRQEDVKKLTSDPEVQVLLAPFLSIRRSPNSVNVRRIFGFLLGVLVEGVPLVSGYLAVLTGFVVFVWGNGGIVVGDRSAHEASLHIPQLFYFTSFTLFFASPYLLTPARMKAFLLACIRHPLRTNVVFLSVLVAIGNFTLVHPYLLADNRHYTFYVWNRFFARHSVLKFALAPVYVYGLWVMYDALRERGVVRVLLFFAGCLAVLVPQRLLEFRYFIVPFLLFRLQMQRPSWWQLGVEFLLYQAVNTATLYLFLNRPFRWPDSSDQQRFMW